jgi:lactate dehydrogenase-like 2-hydroxyacid dehydrogenase
MILEETDARPEIVLIKPVGEALESALDAAYIVHRLYAAASSEALLREVGPRVRGAVATGSSGVPDELWAALPALEVVAVYGVGADKIDFDKARVHGVEVTFTHGVLSEAVADLAIGLWIAAVREIGKGDRYVRSGGWARGEPFPLSRSVSGSAVGILGLGRIGHEIARRAEPFASVIRYHSRRPVEGAPYAWMPDVRALAEASDVLFVAVPGGRGTDGMVDAAALDALGPEGTLVNVARGAVVDEAALVAALREGRLGAAGLDVFVDEPNTPPELDTLDNVVMAPHRGSATRETRTGMADSVLASLRGHLGAAAG